MPGILVRAAMVAQIDREMEELERKAPFVAHIGDYLPLLRVLAAAVKAMLVRHTP